MRRLWIALAGVMAVSFLVLGWVGTRIYQEMPPVPDKVVTSDGKTVIDSGELTAGQNVWQALGGNADYAMPVGAVTNTDRVRKLSAFFSAHRRWR